MSIFDVMDRVDYDSGPDSWEHTAEVYLCPGCQAWSVQIDSHYRDDYIDEYDRRIMALWLINEHREACPAFDMLAVLAGAPPLQDGIP